MNQDPKIGLSLTLPEIMDVIESLPEGHSLLPVLKGKAFVLLHVRMLRLKNLPESAHQDWCAGKSDQDWCTCLLTLKEQ